MWPDAVVDVAEAGGLDREGAAVVDRGAVKVLVVEGAEERARVVTIAAVRVQLLSRNKRPTQEDHIRKGLRHLSKGIDAFIGLSVSPLR